MTADLMIRQGMLIHPDLKRATTVIAGLGMLGSWTAHAMARISAEVLGYDFDTVGPENIGTQAYNGMDEGMDKAKALGIGLAGLSYFGHTERFPPSTIVRAPGPMIVVSAVDSFEQRRLVARWALDWGAALFVDTRAMGLVSCVMIVPPQRLGEYLDTLESDEAAPDVPCGAEGTAFVGLHVASRVAASVNAFFKGLPVPFKLVENVEFGEVLHRES